MFRMAKFRQNLTILNAIGLEVIKWCPFYSIYEFMWRKLNLRCLFSCIPLFLSALFSDGGGSNQIYRSQSSALLVLVCLSGTVLRNSTDPNNTAKCF